METLFQPLSIFIMMTFRLLIVIQNIITENDFMFVCWFAVPLFFRVYSLLKFRYSCSTFPSSYKALSTVAPQVGPLLVRCHHFQGSTFSPTLALLMLVRVYVYPCETPWLLFFLAAKVDHLFYVFICHSGFLSCERLFSTLFCCFLLHDDLSSFYSLYVSLC